MSAAQPSRRRVLTAVFASSLGVGLIFGFQPPLIALVLRRAGVSNFGVGAVIAASLIAVTVAGPFYPALMSRFGLRRSVMAGVCIAASILVLMPLWPGVPVWLVLRALTGCVLGLSWVASEVWLNSVSGAQARGTIMGIYGTVFSTGMMAGPALLTFTGTRGLAPFAIGAGVLLLTLLPLILQGTVTSAPPSFTPMRNFAAAIRRAPAVMWAALTAGLVEAAEITLLPLFGIQSGVIRPDGAAARHRLHER